MGLGSGALAARVADLQMFLVPVSAGALILAHVLSLRRPSRSRVERAILVVTTPLTVLLWILPSLAG